MFGSKWTTRIIDIQVAHNEEERERERERREEKRVEGRRIE